MTEGYALIGPGGTSFFGGNDTVKGLEVPPLETAVGTASFLGFGHRRLSILDLSVGGHQPMYLPERDITLIYNGELYNYMELRAQLEALGVYLPHHQRHGSFTVCLLRMG